MLTANSSHLKSISLFLLSKAWDNGARAVFLSWKCTCELDLRGVLLWHRSDQRRSPLLQAWMGSCDATCCWAVLCSGWERHAPRRTEDSFNAAMWAKQISQSSPQHYCRPQKCLFTTFMLSLLPCHSFIHPTWQICCITAACSIRVRRHLNTLAFIFHSVITEMRLCWLFPTVNWYMVILFSLCEQVILCTKIMILCE